MILTRIFLPGVRDPVGQARITRQGLRNEDDIVTVTDEAALAYLQEEGRGGLCTAKFHADLIVDAVQRLDGEAEFTLGQAVLQMTARRKRCHTGCRLDPSGCLINDRVLFLRVLQPGNVRVGDELIVKN